MPIKGGLTTQSARHRLAQFGPNQLPQTPPPSDIGLLLSQLKNPLVYVLAVAAGVTGILGQWADTTIILVAVSLNTVLGWIQERKANRALVELRQLLHPVAEVVRDGQRVKIPAAEVVPGDWLVLAAGVKIAADGRLVEQNRLFVNEAILTGESQPVAKGVEDMVYMGTVVTAGRGICEVTRTGSSAEIGKIATTVAEQHKEIPLQKQLTRFSRQILVLVLGLVVVVMVGGFLTGRSGWEMAKTAVALAVSAVPEGLLVSLTVVLAIGMQRILKRRGLVRRLSAAETLGGVTTVCVDKTGTLTEGKLGVVQVVGDPVQVATQLLLANDLDDPLVIAAYHWAKTQVLSATDLEKQHSRLDSLPFSAKDRFFASLHPWGKNNLILVNGAPEYLLEWADIPASQKKKLVSQIDTLAKSGKRLLGVATRSVATSHTTLTHTDVKGHQLHWVGLVAFADPVRVGVKEALAQTLAAGVKIIMITGDYPATAQYVLAQLDLPVTADQLLSGEETDTLTDQELTRKAADIKLFARTTPQQKLRIVAALQSRGEIVAVMGDGVNDAPALARANIGIVVGDASDVARETADLVLLDSSFATVVAAIEEGRGIWDNLRKVILYLMCDAFGEIIAVLAALVTGLPLPVTAVQILWINLVSDGFPNLALTVDPKQAGLMRQLPRSPTEHIANNGMRILVGLISLAGGIMAAGLFGLTYYWWSDLALSRSVAFASLGANSLVYVFSIKTWGGPVWKSWEWLNNKWLLVAVAGGWLLQLLPFIYLPLGKFMGVVSLSPSLWVAVVVSAGITGVLIEGFKLLPKIQRSHLTGQKSYIQAN